MSKRRDRDEAHTLDQTDLFGAATPAAPFKKPRPSQSRASPLAIAPSRTPAPTVKNVIGNGLLNVRQAAQRLGLSKSTLDKMRCAGKGPRFIKSTDRAVRYDPADLDAWIADRRHTRTSRE
ncbi:MAG: helix-turn-helix domain-containing protein [Hyphomonadaceae bacterium]|nr:helix-turn-helix domain-containing protein [Hyphomonadaceae bacterium]